MVVPDLNINHNFIIEEEILMSDKQTNLPDQGKIECIDAIESALGRDGFIAFLRGQIIKYQWSIPYADDPTLIASKAAWYAEQLHQFLEQRKLRKSR